MSELQEAFLKFGLFTSLAVVTVGVITLLRFVEWYWRPGRFECTYCFGKGYHTDGKATGPLCLSKCNKCRAHGFSFLP